MPLEETGVSFSSEGSDAFISAFEQAGEAAGGFGSAIEAASAGIDVAGEIITGALRAVGEIAVNALLSAGSAVAAFIGDSFAGALEAEQTMARLGQVIESTGGIAGVTVADAEALADEFKNLAGGSDDAIISIIDMGLRMGTVSSDEMPAFIQSTLDLGAVMGDAGKAAQLMARAQEDPVGVLGALRKAGILVNETTEAQIKAMVASGDTAGAYALVMDRVGEATAGAAETMALTTAGQWAIFQETIADAGETIMGAFLPALMAIAGPILETVVPAIAALAGILATSFENLLNGNIRAGLEGLGESLFEVFPPEVAGPLNDALTWLSTNLQAFVAFVTANLPLMQSTFETVWTSIQGVLQVVGDFITVTLLPAIATIWESTGAELPTAQQTFESVMAGIVAATQIVADFITNILVPAFTVAVDWVVANWPQIQATIETVINAVSDVITNVVAAVVAFWQTNGATLVSDTTSTFSTIQSTIDSVITTIQGIITTVLGALQSFWAAHGDSIVTIVSTTFENISNTINTVISAIQSIITTALSIIEAFWSQWGSTILSIAATSWAAIQTVIDNAVTIIGAVIDAFAAAVTGDWSAFGEALRTIWDALWENFITIIGAGITNIIAIISTGITNIINAFSSVDWASIGIAVIQGIANGISGAVGGLVNAAVNAANDAFNAARSALGISSPSRLFAELGEQTMQGMSLGVQTGVSDTVGAVQDAAIDVGNAFTDTNYQLGAAAGEAFSTGYSNTINMLAASLGMAMQSAVDTGSNILAGAANDYANTIDTLYASLGGSGSYTAPPPQQGGPPPPTTNTVSPVYGGPMPPVAGGNVNTTDARQFILNATTGRPMQNVQAEFSTMQVLAGIT